MSPPNHFGQMDVGVDHKSQPCLEQLPKGKRITNAAGAKCKALMFLRIHQKSPTKTRPQKNCFQIFSDHVNDSSGRSVTLFPKHLYLSGLPLREKDCAHRANRLGLLAYAFLHIVWQAWPWLGLGLACLAC